MTLMQRYRSLPRAGRWTVWAVLLMGGYFLLVEPALAFSARVRGEADTLQASLAARAKTAERLANTAALLEQSMVALGSPALPAGADPLPALDRKINAVLQSHGITPRRRVPRPPAPLLTGEGAREPARLGAGGAIQRAGWDLELECDTAQLAKTLKDLEAAPEVASISRLSIRKAGDGRSNDQKLAVSMTVEAWTLGAEAGAGAGGAGAGAEGAGVNLP